MSSVQLEAILTYTFTDAFSIGVGGRYWKLETEPGAVAIQVLNGGRLQAGTIETERWAGFLQASYKFGEARPIR